MAPILANDGTQKTRLLANEFQHYVSDVLDFHRVATVRFQPEWVGPS